MRALFLVNGLGLGNSTRCHAIIQRLAELGFEVQVITSGNGLWYFRDRPEVAAVHEIESLYYAANAGRINVLRTLLCIPEFISIARRNATVLTRVLDQFRPQVAITDSVYVFRPIKRRGIALAALNNSDVVHVSYRLFKDRPASIRAQFYAIEESDYFFHGRVPSLTLSPTLDSRLASVGGPYHRIGPIVRRGYEPPARRSGVSRVVVMLSGSRFGTAVRFENKRRGYEIDVVGREAPEDLAPSPGVRYHGKIRDNRALLSGADLVVVNGGFSAVSEIFSMRIPMLVVPVPNHAEQWVNARTIQHLGVGVIAAEEGLESSIDRGVESIEEWRDGYDRITEIPNGAQQAAEALVALSGAK